jgi:hypothetical protein
MAHHAPAPVCAVCGAPGRLIEEDIESQSGYVVACTNRFCTGVPSMCDREATMTKDAAWQLWRWKQTGVCR